MATTDWAVICEAALNTHGDKLQLWCRVTAQDITTNKSSVSWELRYVASTWGTWSNIATAWSVGSGLSGSGTWTIPTAGVSKTIGSGSTTIAHSADGTYSLLVSFTSAKLSSFNAVSASGWFHLPTIPRGSTLALGSTVAIGGAVSGTIARNSPSFTHTIDWYVNGSFIASTTGLTTSVSWTVPASVAAKIPAANSATAKAVLKTLSGSTVIAESSYAFTITVPTTTTYQPSFAYTLERIDNTVPTAWALYVQAISQVRALLSSVAAGSGATISSWKITVGATQSYTGTTASYVWTSAKLVDSGTVPVTISVTDSRGRTSTQSATLTVYANQPPSVTGSGYRSTAAGVADDDTGTAITVKAVSSISSVSNKNSVTARAVAYSTDQITWTSAATWAESTNKIITGMGLDTAYYVRMTATDALGQVGQVIIFIPAAVTLIDTIPDLGLITVGKPARAADNGYSGIRFDPRGSNPHTTVHGGLFTDVLYQKYGNVINLPNVFAFHQSSNPVSGTMKIKLPVSKNNTMMVLTIEGYNYGVKSWWKCVISGYNYTSGWVNTGYKIEGNPPFTTVRLAHDGANNCVLLGITSTTWSYPAITVSAQLHYTGSTAVTWAAPGNWAATFLTTEPTWSPTPVVPTWLGNSGIVWLVGPTAARNGIWYRRVDATVELHVNLGSESNISVTSAGVALGTLPEGFRPPENLVGAATGKANNLGQLNVYTTGGVQGYLFAASSMYFGASLFWHCV